MKIPVVSRKTLKYILAGVVAMVVILCLVVMSRRAQSNYESIPGSLIKIQSMTMSSNNSIAIMAGGDYKFTNGEIVAIFLDSTSNTFSVNPTDGTVVMSTRLYFDRVLPVGTVITQIANVTSSNTFTINGTMTGKFPGAGNVEPIASFVKRKIDMDFAKCKSKPTPMQKQSCISDAVKPYTVNFPKPVTTQPIPMPTPQPVTVKI